MAVRVCCMASVMVWHAALGAQGRPPSDRSERALFGGGYGATGHSLILGGQAGAGASTGSRRGEDGTDSGSSQSATWDGTLAYSLGRGGLELGADARSSARYFLSARGATATANSGRLNVSFSPGQRTQVFARGGIVREPLSALAFLPGFEDDQVVPIDPLDYSIGEAPLVLVRKDVSVGINQNLSRRTTVSFSYYASEADGGGESDAGIDRWTGGFLGSLRHAVGRDLGVRIGYGLDTAEYQPSDAAPAVKVRRHRIDLGVDYGRSLSISRRTTLSFSTGSMVLADEGHHRYEIVGSAVLRHQMGRTWQSSLEYTRDAGFLDVLTKPAFVQSLTSTVSGRVGGRLRVFGDAGASEGQVGGVISSSDYALYRVGGGLSVDFARLFGVGVRYSYFRYRLSGEDDLVGGLSSSFSRQTIRIGLEMSAPLFVRSRRP